MEELDAETFCWKTNTRGEQITSLTRPIQNLNTQSDASQKGCFYFILDVFSHESNMNMYMYDPTVKGSDYRTFNIYVYKQYICKYLFDIAIVKQSRINLMKGLIIECTRQCNYYTMNPQVLVRGEMSMWQLQD